MHLTKALLLFTLCAVGGTTTAQARNLTIATCEPEWASLTSQLAGKQATITSLTNPMQDPHTLEAKPGLIAKVRNADLLICTGLSLEEGWLPALLEQANNTQLEAGNALYVGNWIPTIDKPKQLDRADGDVHAQGNPHIQLNPNHMPVIANGISAALQTVDPANKAVYQQALAQFNTTHAEQMAQLTAKSARLSGNRIISYHKDFAYLFNWLGITMVNTIEPKPSVPPSAAYLNQLVSSNQSKLVCAISRSPYQPAKATQWVATQLAKPDVVLASTVGQLNTTNLWSLYHYNVDQLLKVCN